MKMLTQELLFHQLRVTGHFAILLRMTEKEKIVGRGKFRMRWEVRMP